MKKINIAIITPYEELKDLVNSVFEEKKYNLEISVSVGDLEAGVEIAKEAEKKGTDIIISRGGTAELIEQVVSVPVIDIEISSYDMLCVVTLIKDYPGKVAIVGFPSIAKEASILCSLLDIKLDIFVVHDAIEVESMLLELNKKGFSLIVGDVIAVQSARRLGLGSVLLASGRESVIKAFEEAVKIYNHMFLLENKLSMFRGVIENIEEGILVFDPSYKVVFQNNSAKEHLAELDLGSSYFTEWGSKLSSKKRSVTKINKNNRLWDIHMQKLGSEDQQTFIIVRIKKCTDTQSISGVSIKNTMELNSMLHSNDIYKNIINENMKEIVRRAEIYSEDEALLVIFGEPGTGKESLAVYLHQHNQSEMSPFMKIDCSLFNEGVWDVLEDFISSVEKEGTVFIKNIHLLSQEQKSKIIHLLSTTSIKPMVIISCIYKDEFIEADTIINITIPPLRERIEDIELFVRLFISRYNLKLGKQIVGIRSNALERVVQYHWHGNINQIEKVIKELCLICNNPFIELDLVDRVLEGEAEVGVPMSSSLLEGTLEDIEKKIIMKVWLEENKNHTNTANRLGINRSTLWRKLK